MMWISKLIRDAIHVANKQSKEEYIHVEKPAHIKILILFNIFIRQIWHLRNDWSHLSHIMWPQVNTIWQSLSRHTEHRIFFCKSTALDAIFSNALQPCLWVIDCTYCLTSCKKRIPVQLSTFINFEEIITIRKHYNCLL